LLVKSVLDGDIFPLDPAMCAQLLSERVYEHRHTGSSACIQETYAKDFSRLLRLPGTAKRKEHDAKSKDGDFFLHAFYSVSIHSTLNTRPFSLDPLFARSSAFGGSLNRCA
jgi:hypothetical protein